MRVQVQPRGNRLFLAVTQISWALRPAKQGTMHIGYKAGVGTRKNWPYNQYGLISDIPMESLLKGLKGLI